MRREGGKIETNKDKERNHIQMHIRRQVSQDKHITINNLLKGDHRLCYIVKQKQPLPQNTPPFTASPTQHFTHLPHL